MPAREWAGRVIAAMTCLHRLDLVSPAVPEDWPGERPFARLFACRVGESRPFMQGQCCGCETALESCPGATAAAAAVVDSLPAAAPGRHRVAVRTFHPRRGDWMEAGQVQNYLKQDLLG